MHGPKKWALISKSFRDQHQILNKSGKQCRERWNNNLSPAVTKDSWTYNEEKILFEKHKVFGNKWSEIAKFLKGRTDNSTKNHFYSIVRKNLRRYNKSKPDKEKISGSIKDLIQDSALMKILLKKPRHYHNKNNRKNKKALDKQVILQKKSQSKPISRKNKNHTNTLEIIHKTEAPEQKIEIPSTIYCPTPISNPPLCNLYGSTFIFPYENTMDNVVPDNDNPLMLTQPITSANTGFFRGDRKDSLIFSDISESFRLRNDSRNNSNKSIYSDLEFFRDLSRKNSEKTSSGFAPLDLKSPRNINSMIFPPFSPKSSLDYYPTPKNKK